MEVTVRFTGLLRRLAERDYVKLDLGEGASLRQALSRLEEKLPDDFSREVLVPILRGVEIPTVLVWNRTSVHRAEELDQKLEDGDIIAFATPMEGG